MIKNNDQRESRLSTRKKLPRHFRNREIDAFRSRREDSILSDESRSTDSLIFHATLNSEDTCDISQLLIHSPAQLYYANLAVFSSEINLYSK